MCCYKTDMTFNQNTSSFNTNLLCNGWKEKLLAFPTNLYIYPHWKAGLSCFHLQRCSFLDWTCSVYHVCHRGKAQCIQINGHLWDQTLPTLSFLSWHAVKKISRQQKHNIRLITLFTRLLYIYNTKRRHFVISIS